MKTLLIEGNLAAFLPAEGKELWVWDTQEAGLGLRVRAGKTEVTRNWYLSYSIAGVDRRDPIGKFSEFSLGEARAHVHKRRRDLAEDCLDPRARKAELVAEAATLKTLFEAIEAFFAQGHTWAPSTERAHERYLRGTDQSEPYFKPLLEKPIKRITREQIATRLAEIAKRSKFAAKQARTSLREVYRYACGMGWVDNLDVINGTLDPAPKKNFVPRNRVLDNAELVEVWNAADALIRLLILTGCRRAEIGNLKWSELDGNVLHLPAKRTKTKVARDLPLSDAAMALLAGIPRVEGRDRVFSNCSWSYIKGKLPALATPWRLHDIRRTMRTGLSEIGIFPHIAELCIGHKREKIIGTYDLAKQWAEQVAAFNRWAAHVESLMQGAHSNVVPLRAA